MDLPRSRSRSGHPEELTRLVADRIGELEGTRQTANLAQPVCEVAFSFRLKPPARLFTPHPGEPASLLPESSFPFVSVPRPISVDNPRSCRAAVNGAPVRSRSSSSNPRHSGPWSIRCSSTTSPHPSQTVSTVLVVTRPSHSGTLIRPRVGLDVFVERRLVDVSSCHRSHRVSGTRQYSEPLTH